MLVSRCVYAASMMLAVGGMEQLVGIEIVALLRAAKCLPEQYPGTSKPAGGLDRCPHRVFAHVR